MSFLCVARIVFDFRCHRQDAIRLPTVCEVFAQCKANPGALGSLGIFGKEERMFLLGNAGARVIDLQNRKLFVTSDAYYTLMD